MEMEKDLEVDVHSFFYGNKSQINALGTSGGGSWPSAHTSRRFFCASWQILGTSKWAMFKTSILDAAARSCSQKVISVSRGGNLQC